MSKLLHKPFRAFTGYALLLLAISVPIYYYTVDRIWLLELDEHNSIIKYQVEQYFANNELSDAELRHMIETWSSFQPGTKLTPVTQAYPTSDSIYTVTKINEYDPEQGSDRFRGLATYISIDNSPYLLTIETNIEEADETMTAIALVTFLLYGFMVLGFIVINRRMARNIWAPFNDTLQKLRDFDLNERKPINLQSTDIEEFEQLNQELDKLITRNLSSFEQQKTFIENASHELQTPLAVIRSKIDLLLQNEHLDRDASDTVEAMSTAISRVSRINKNLLLLAKIENLQFDDEEIVELAPLIAESMELLSDHFSNKHLQVTAQLEHAIVLKANRSLVEILINNLLTNAIRHTEAGGQVQVSLSENSFIISNSGTSALEAEHIFKRFVITSSNTSSSGLGLSIVKEIADRYGWSADYVFKDGSHIFSIKFS